MVSFRDKLPSGLFPLILAGLLAALTFWLEQTSRPVMAGKSGKFRHDPDYYVENLTLRRYDPDGLLQHTLQAAHMRHFPDDDTTEIDAPRLAYHRRPGTYISARTARLNSDATHVRLHEDVSVTRNSVGNRPGSVLTTQSLDAYPDEEIVATDVPVTFRQGRSILHGGALRANNKTSIYVLEGPVRGDFYRNGEAPPAPPQTILPRPPASKSGSGTRKKKPIPPSKPVLKSGR